MAVLCATGHRLTQVVPARRPVDSDTSYQANPAMSIDQLRSDAPASSSGAASSPREPGEPVRAVLGDQAYADHDPTGLHHGVH